LRTAIEVVPRNAAAHTHLAWLLAAGPDEIRDGREAVEHATTACELTNWMAPRCTDILASAYAEAGDFAKAIDYQEQALAFPKFAQEQGVYARQRLELYRCNLPYRAPALRNRSTSVASWLWTKLARLWRSS
jgi:tetratricopeptide (TPR) repeat protein